MILARRTWLRQMRSGTKFLSAVFSPHYPSPVSSRKRSPMSSTDNDMRTSAAKRSSMSRDSDDLATQVEAIRADIQNLTSTVGRIANKQLGRAQDTAMNTAHEAEEAIRRNPLSAVAIAVGLGFLFGVFTRR
jgi:ElaB/YqjD/DUF883 family membrane-anchored ribosome-binding protein